jgi:hypothetical protein
MWSNKPVSKIVGENLNIDDNYRIFVKKENMTQPLVAPVTKPKTTPKKPFSEPVKPTRRTKPFLPEVAPGTITQPKALK